MKKRIKLIAYILSMGMTFTGCKADFEEILKDFNISPNYPTSSTTEDDNDFTIGESIDEIIQDIEPTSSEETIPETTAPEETITENTIVEENIETTIPETTVPEETIQIMPEEVLEQNEIVTATTNVNIRTGSTINALKIGMLNIGEQAVRILSCNNGWSLVRTNDKVGYINNNYLENSNTIIDSEIEHTLKNDIVLTTTDLNFRKDPSSESEKILQFPTNTELQVVAITNNDWLLVKYNDTLGYVHKDYTMSLLEVAKEQYPDLNIEELATQKVVYSNTTLNIRNGNSTDFDQIGQLEKYESVRVLGEYEEWYFIMTNDYSFGFISKEYTKTLDGVYIIVDKSEQQLYMYNENELYYTTPVTTGKDSTPSDTGLFNIYSKETNRYLTDGKTYNAWVQYWMPYNRGEGLHDATWRSVFGTESYHYGGSHGCINIPPEIADDIYNSASIGDKVLVHK